MNPFTFNLYILAYSLLIALRLLLVVYALVIFNPDESSCFLLPTSLLFHADMLSRPPLSVADYLELPLDDEDSKTSCVTYSILYWTDLIFLNCRPLLRSSNRILLTV